MVDKSGKYRMNAQIGRSMDAARGSLKGAVAKPAREGPEPKHESPGGEEHGPIGHIEYHPHPEGGIDSHTHHHDGHVEEAHHEDEHEAAEHLIEHGPKMEAEDGDKEPGDDGEDASDEDDGA